MPEPSRRTILISMKHVLVEIGSRFVLSKWMMFDAFGKNKSRDIGYNKLALEFLKLLLPLLENRIL
ncbi:hypothetical protein EVAR_72260_1, partial [Eumeta japonica]